MTPESLPEELPPQIWNNWSSADNVAFDLPDITTSELDWVSGPFKPNSTTTDTTTDAVGFHNDGPRPYATTNELG